MSNLNIGQAELSLMMDPNVDRFLIEDVIGGTTSMKAVRQNIYDYDAAVAIAVDILKRRLALLDGGSNGSEEADSSNNLNEGENNDAPTIT